MSAPESTTHAAPAPIGHAGIVAQSVHVETQYINLRGQPEWIQAVGLDELKEARRKLYRASIRHDAWATFPIVIMVAVSMLVVACITFAVGKGYHYTDKDRVMLLAVALQVAFPIWFASRDSRRRHMMGGKAADRRWAEIDIEISMREPPKPRLSAYRMFRNWIAERRASNASD